MVKIQMLHSRNKKEGKSNNQETHFVNQLMRLEENRNNQDTNVPNQVMTH